MFDDIVTLIWPIDAEREEKNDVFARVESISQAEFFAGAQAGLKPEYKISLRADDYSGQPLVIARGKRYSVYRTYTRTDQKTELYVSDKAGVRGGK